MPAGHPSSEGSGRFWRGWRLAGTAWKAVAASRTLQALGVLSVACGAVVWLASLPLVRGAGGAGGIPLAYLAAFLGTFVNVAIASAAASALHGRTTTVRGALAVSASRPGPVLGLALIAATVGIALRMGLASVAPAGRPVLLLLNWSWWLATIFAEVSIALAGTGPIESIRRALGILGHRWGETAGGTLLILGAGAGAGILVSLVIAGGFALGRSSPLLALALVIGGFVAGGVVAAMARATIQTFAVTVYRLEMGGEAALERSPAAIQARPERA